MFVDADGDTLTYTATVNDVAQTLTGSVLTYAPAAAGTYTVVLTASDNTGTATHTITLTAADAAMLPRLKDGVSATASATAAVGYAYNLTDLQTGKIFENPDGSSWITPTTIIIERSIASGPAPITSPRRCLGPR